MDWNKAKSLFILVFFILDIFLIYQFIDFRADKLEVNKGTNIEDKLKADGIKYENLSQNTENEKTISGTPKEFNESDFKNATGQAITVVDKTMLSSHLSQPIKIGNGAGKYNALETFIRKNVYNGNEYKFWGKSKDGRKITYYQTYKDRMLYNNIYGQLEFTVNELNEVIFYEQTILEDIEEFNENQTIAPLQAVESLYNRDYLPRNSEITSAKLGYYTLLQVSQSKVVVFVPTWHIKVNGKEDYFVNNDGQVLTLKEKLTE